MTDFFTYIPVLYRMYRYRTIEAIAKHIISQLSENDRVNLKTIPKDQLILFHHSFGRNIRNHYGLWNPKHPITREWINDGDGWDRHPCHPDATSHKVMIRAWEMIQ
jgi:hypothetical protein